MRSVPRILVENVALVQSIQGSAVHLGNFRNESRTTSSSRIY